MIFCSLYSGSSGNSTFVASEKTKLLIDAGLPGKKITEGLISIDQNPNEIDGIFVTHEHIDHIKGVGVLSRKYDIPIYANELTWKAMQNQIGKIKEHNIKIIENGCVSIKDVDVTSYKIPHDAADPSGYAIDCKGKRACIATDLGHFTDEVKEKIKDADVVLLESNHDLHMLEYGPYPYSLKCRIMSNIGHLSNDDCGSAILDIAGYKDKKIVLGHLSKINNYPDLAYKTVYNILAENGLKVGGDIGLSLARREAPSSFIEF